MKYYQHRDYLRMLVNGLVYNYDYLPQYLIREQQKAHNNHIGFSEFIGRTITVIQDLEGEFRRLRDLKIQELEGKKDGENDKDINEKFRELSITKDFKLPLEVYTDGEFCGHLGFWDINHIRIAINTAFDFYSIEYGDERDDGPVEYFLREVKEKEAMEINVPNTIPTVNPYPEVFKSLEAYSLFQKLYNSYKNSQTQLADFSFIYRKMFDDGLLCDHQKPETFRRWLSNEPYKVVLDNKFKLLSNCTTRGKENAYINAKLLLNIPSD